MGKTNYDIITEVEIELKRFVKKLSDAKKVAKGNTYDSPNKEFAACKRAALDMKRELTKLTQSSNYKWKN